MGGTYADCLVQKQRMSCTRTLISYIKKHSTTPNREKLGIDTSNKNGILLHTFSPLLSSPSYPQHFHLLSLLITSPPFSSFFSSRFASCFLLFFPLLFFIFFPLRPSPPPSSPPSLLPLPSSQVVTLLLHHGADANSRDNWSYTPLHEAAIKGKIDVCIGTHSCMHTRTHTHKLSHLLTHTHR